jgi:Putative Ig domain
MRDMKISLPACLLLLFLSNVSLASVDITTKTLPNGTVGTPFSAVVDASGGCTPYKWALVSGSLPKGVSKTASSNTESLDLKGTPSTAGTYSFTISVTGCGGEVSRASYTTEIKAESVDITTKTLPNGMVDTPFSAVVDASGGCTPYKWALVSGSLPKGVSKSASSNTESLDLKGTPSAAGSYSFTISVTGCGGHVSEAAYKVSIQSTSNDVVDLSWKASTSGNITGYNVYRSPNGSSWSRINAGLVGSTIYDDDTVVNGNTYYYAVTAVNLEGAESGKSGSIKVVIP